MRSGQLDSTRSRYEISVPSSTVRLQASPTLQNFVAHLAGDAIGQDGECDLRRAGGQLEMAAARRALDEAGSFERAEPAMHRRLWDVHQRRQFSQRRRMLETGHRFDNAKRLHSACEIVHA